MESFGSLLLAPVRHGHATRKFVVLTAGACAAAFLVFLAFLAGTGRLASIGSLTLPAYAFIDLLGLAFLAIATPYGVIEWIESRRIAQIEEKLPDFLSDLASLHKAGLTLMDAIEVCARGRYGALTPEIRHAAAQIEWGVPALEALAQLRDRCATPVVSRTLTVVIEAGHTGGNVKEVLAVAADVARRLSLMRRQRRSEMSLYLMIVYVASLVFLFVVVALQAVFIPRMAEAVTGAGGGASAFGFGRLPPVESFRGLYVATAIVQGAGNGICAGMFSEGKAEAGVKHGAILTGISLATLWLFG